jgi:predicted nucleic acid-binding protein
MELIERLRPHRVYLDSNIFIYAFENYVLYPECAEVMRALVADEISGVASEIALLEILPKPVHGGRPALGDAYLEAMATAGGLALVPVTREVILRAVSLRAAAKINSLDAVHIATAIDAGCDLLLTNDFRLRPPPQLRAIYLEPRQV